MNATQTLDKRATRSKNARVPAVEQGSANTLVLRVRIIQAALAGFVLLTLYPVKYLALITDSFDNWWVAALNYARLRNFVFGKDIEFTYGPFGYLAFPMPFGTNLEQGIAIQVTAWLGFGLVLAWLVSTKRIATINWMVLAICGPAGAQLFRYLPGRTAGLDYFLELLAVLLTGASFMAATRVGSSSFYLAAVGIAAFLVLMKLSAGMAAVAFVFAFPLALALIDRARAMRLFWIAVVGTPALLSALFLLSGAPWNALPRYLRAGLEISSGYNSAMSLDGPSEQVIPALGILTGFVVLAVTLYLRRDRSFPIAAAILGPVFLEFKHSFVRQDAHVESLFKFAPLALSITLLFMDLNWRKFWRGRSGALAVAGLSLITLPWFYFENGHYYYQQFPWETSDSPFSSLANRGDLTRVARLKEELRQASMPALTQFQLPRELLAHVGDHTITVYPWNVVYAAANPIRFVPFPVLQAYSAYTPYLDAWDAEFLNDPDRRPEYVLFEWQQIDGRNPMLDSPQTALALVRNYQMDGVYGDKTLLRVRQQPLLGTMHLVNQSVMKVGEPLQIEGDHAAAIRIFLDYTIAGRMREFFFRTSPVIATLYNSQALGIRVRVPPAVISGGVPLNSIPANLDDARKLFETGRTSTRFDHIVISGPGVASFSPTARVDVYQLDGLP